MGGESDAAGPPEAGDGLGQSALALLRAEGRAHFWLGVCTACGAARYGYTLWGTLWGVCTACGAARYGYTIAGDCAVLGATRLGYMFD